MPTHYVAVLDPQAPRDLSAAVDTWAAASDATVSRTVPPDPAALGSAIEDVRSGEAAGIVVPAVEVLGDVLHQEAVRMAVERVGGQLHIVYERDQGDADVRELLRAYSIAASELESRVKKAQMQRGADKKRAAGGRVGGRTALGMRVVAGQVVEDAREIAVRTRVLALYDQGISYAGIARQMAAEGYLTKDGKATWWPGTVQRIVLRARQAS